MKPLFPLLLLAGLIGGCASAKEMAPVSADLSRAGVVTPEQKKRLEAAMTDKEIAAMLTVDIKAKVPTWLAIARLQDDSQSWPGRYAWRRSGPVSLAVVGSGELDGWEKALTRERSIKGLRAVSPMLVTDSTPTIHSMRSAAAQMNCELLLVYLQADGAVDNYTDAAAAYWTLIGLWVSPGNVYERKTVMQAALVDCRTGMILGTASGESTMKTAYPAAYERIAHDKLDAQTPAKALEDLQDRAGRMIGQVVAAAEREAAKP